MIKQPYSNHTRSTEAERVRGIIQVIIQLIIQVIRVIIQVRVIIQEVQRLNVFE
jgi:hypothetical protein